MKQSFFVTILGFFLTTCVVLAEDSVAVVDLQKIVSGSSQVKQLKQDYAKKMEELNKIIINARGEISNETDENKILKIEEKYTSEFNTKKSILDKEYNSRLSTIEKNIRDEITKKAKKDNYDYVFAKGIVLYGGKDITDQIDLK